MMTLGAALFDEIRERWAAQIGSGELDALQAHLTRLAARRSRTRDLPLDVGPGVAAQEIDG
jgi:hypothetical protein